MSLTKVYLRALRYLTEERLRVSIVVVSNIVLALVAIAEPILFGRIIDAMSSGANSLPVLIAWAGLGIFNTVAFVLVAREADRLAHSRRSGLLAEAFSRIISMPLAWHSQRGTSNVLHTLLRACETLFGLWLEFMRTHLSTAVALVLLVPAALSMDVRLSIVLLLLGVLYWLTGQVVMNRTREGQAAVEEHYHQVFSHVSDTISNVPVLHSYNRIERETQALKEYTGRLLSAQFPVLDWWALASALNRIASTISMMAILILGSIMVKSGEIKVGDVIAFIGFANLLISGSIRSRALRARFSRRGQSWRNSTNSRIRSAIARSLWRPRTSAMWQDVSSSAMCPSISPIPRKACATSRLPWKPGRLSPLSVPRAPARPR